MSFLKKYREDGFITAMNSFKEIATKMEIEPIFCGKRIIRKKKQFDENVNDETTQSAEEYFRINYFLYIQQIKLFLQLKVGLHNFKYMKIFLVFYLILKN